MWRAGETYIKEGGDIPTSFIHKGVHNGAVEVHSGVEDRDLILRLLQNNDNHSNLLQRLWDQFVLYIDRIIEIEKDDSLDVDDALDAISEAIDDTPEMAQLRQELREAGIKIGGDA